METKNENGQDNLMNEFRPKNAKLIYIILGYFCSVVGGVNGASGLDLIINYRCGIIYRIVVVVSILIAFLAFRWAGKYVLDTVSLENGEEYYKYATPTRIHGFLMWIVLIVFAVMYYNTLRF